MTHGSWSTAWITGASTGIGREMALMLAGAGVRVAVTARTAARLDELAAEGQGRIYPFPADVSDREAMAAVAASIRDTIGHLDLVILNAGILEPMGARRFKAETAMHSMQVNYGGIVNGTAAVLPAMLARGSGHIAFVASVAGYRGVPKSAAYGPTKAAIINLSECLGHDLHGTGVTLTVINPGFIETPMTKINRFPMPYILKAEDAAARILKGLAKKKLRIAFPWQMTLLMGLAHRAPLGVYFWFWRTFMGEGPMPPDTKA